MSNYNLIMKKALFLTSKIREKGNNFIISKLKECGYNELFPSHGDILVLLYQYGELTMKDIADKIHRTKPTVTVLVDKLEKTGLVQREKSTSDSRITKIKLTQKGQDLKPLFEKISEELNKVLYNGFSENETKTLEYLLEKMLKNVLNQ